MIFITHTGTVLFIAGALLLCYGLTVPVSENKPDNRDVYATGIGVALLAISYFL